MIGWGGEDVPGHPVPINKEGNACMHMQRDNEGIRLPKLLGLAVAGATLLAGMVVLPATQASAANDQYGFSTDDNFKTGDLDPTVQPNLTVTKYFSLVDGYAATGSANDVNKFSKDKDLTPAKGIRFHVYEVQPKGDRQLSDIVAGDEQTWEAITGKPVYTGDTDGQGVISQWYAQKSDGSPDTTSPLQFPKGAGHYFVLKEDQTGSPAFDSQNPQHLDITKYSVSTNAFFGLPYSTNGSDANSTHGYIYNLHLFPKNRHSSAFTKTVQGVKTSAGEDKTDRVAQAGDKISYKLSQTIYNDQANHKTKDGKLDTHELVGSGQDLRIVDRMSSALSAAPTDFTVAVSYKDNADSNKDKSLPLAKDTDYSLSTPTTNPQRILVSTAHMFTDNPDRVSYFQFDFFNGNATDTTGIIKKMQALPATVFQLDITYTATVTSKGGSSGTDGVANDAASDFTENTDKDGNPVDPIHEHTNVVNAVFAFGSIKSDSDDYAALPGTQYRLVDPDNQDKYLASDGKFYSEGADLPTGVTLFEATANKDGLVVFAGLPVFGSATAPQSKAATDTVKAGIDWRVLETKTPEGWRNPGFPFQKVSYDNYKGQTADEIVKTIGPNAPIEPDYKQLNFGKFDAPAGEVPTKAKIKFHNVEVQKYLMHYATDSSESPLALPLTGGRGILLLLVVGALLMGGALYARSRRNNAARA